MRIVIIVPVKNSSRINLRDKRKFFSFEFRPPIFLLGPRHFPWLVLFGFTLVAMMAICFSLYSDGPGGVKIRQCDVVYFTLVLVVAHLFSFIIMSRVNNNDRLPGAAAFRTGQSPGRRPLSFSMSERISNASRAVYIRHLFSLSLSHVAALLRVVCPPQLVIRVK